MTVLPSHERLDAWWARGCSFLGTELAVMGGAMTWVSERHLVAAISNAGGFGVIACGSMSPDLLALEIRATRAMTGRPFGVNLIVLHPDLDRLVEVCVEQGVGHVVLAGGLPPRGTIERLKAAGARTICFAPSLAIARKLVRGGADALVIEGHEAGGHVGPVSTSVLAQEILPAMTDVPVFVAGGIGHGEAIGGLSAHGRGRRADRHRLRLRRGIDRPPGLQAGLHQGQRPRRRRHGAGRSGVPGHTRCGRWPTRRRRLSRAPSSR